MGGWILAQGKDAEQTIPEIIPAGAKQITLINADLIFSPGDLLFISESDGAETEFLGGATVVTPSTVDFALPLRASKNSGALLWRAARSFASSGDETKPVRERVRTGVALERSTGGAAYAIRTAQPATLLDWELGGLTPARNAAFADWFASAGGGLDPFTLVSPARKITAVRLADEEYQRTIHESGAIALRLHLSIEAEGEYV